MAQTKRKRRRKHRGTPAGNVVRPTSGAKARGRGKGKATDPKEEARQRREERMNREPTWRGAVSRAAIAAAMVSSSSMTAITAWSTTPSLPAKRAGEGG